MKRLLFNLLILSNLLIVLGFFGLKYHLDNYWKEYYSYQELIELTNKINSVNEIPIELIDAYKIVYNLDHNMGVLEFELKMGWNLLTLNKQGIEKSLICPCIMAAEEVDNKIQSKRQILSTLYLAHAIETIVATFKLS